MTFFIETEKKTLKFICNPERFQTDKAIFQDEAGGFILNP
jgi:hypothetical protein